MIAGELKHRIVIQSKGATQNTFGEEVESWSTVATVWAAIIPLVGREYYEAKQEQAEVTTKMRLRYRSGITTAMRVTYGSHVYDIESVIYILEGKREVVLMCREVVS